MIEAAALQFVISMDAGRRDVTSEVRGFEFSTRSPGGFWEARVELETAPRDIWQYYHTWPGGTLMIRALGALIWQGDLVGFRTLDPLTVMARGEVLRLRMPEIWRVFADARYTGWTPGLGRKRSFTVDNNNRVYVAGNCGVIYEDGDFGEVSYPKDSVVLGGPGVGEIVRFEATVDVNIDDGDWVVMLLTDLGTELWATITSVEAGTIDVAVPYATGLVWRLMAIDRVNLGDLDCDDEAIALPSARLTDVVVRTMDPTLSDDVIEAILAEKEIESFDVQAPGLELDRATWQGERALVALEDVVALGDGTAPWVFVVYEYGAIFRAWATAPDWILLKEDLVQGWSLEQDRDDVRNAVRARFPDGWVSFWQEDADSIATYGRHEETLRLPRTGYAEAVRYAQVYLEEHAEPVGVIEADAGAWIHKGDLTSWPAYFVRAGDVIAVRDVVPGEDVLIRVAETRFDGRRLRILPVGADNRLETILATLERKVKRL